MSEEIARAYVRILASDEGFREDAAAKIRAALAGLHPSVEVNAETGEAETKLAALDVIIREVGASSPSIHVDADTAAADAELAATKEVARSVGDESPTVRVDADNSAAESSVAGLFTYATALGPIVIPVVAAGIGGLTGLASGLGAAAAAAGTAYLGISGVSGAVKDMEKASASAGKTAAKSAGSQANSAQQLQLAEMSLANARANASDQAIAAEERLANAEQQERDAQTALTQARKDAQHQLQSYTLQLADANLAERQSKLDVEQAKQARDQADAAGSGATKLQRQQAQLSYEEALQHNKDLLFSNQQLREQASAAAKAGVDGSQQVISAQEHLHSAQQAVTDAQRNQASVQRQSAMSVAQAQAAVANAMRSSGAAATTTDAAVSKLAADMAKLAPAGQEFAKFIYGLRGDFTDLKKTAEQGMLPGVESGIKALLPLLPSFNTFIAGTSAELGSLADQAGHALNTPYWHTFFDYVSRNAAPTMQEMGDVTGNLAHGFAGLMMAFEPVQQQMGAGLEKMSRDFAKFGESAGTNSGFQHFLTYVEANGPLVVHTLGDLAKAGGDLLGAAAPLGPPLLIVVDALARLVQMNPTLFALGIEFIAWDKTFGSLIGKSSGVARSIGLLGTAAEGTGKAASKASMAFTPWVAAIAATTLAVTYGIGEYKKYNDEVKAAEDQANRTQHTFRGLTGALQDEKDSLDKASHSWNLFQRAAASSASQKQEEDIINLANNVGSLTGAFGLSKDAAVLLAQAAGVDLVHGVGGAATQVAAYVQANYGALTSNNKLTGTILTVDAAVMTAKDGFNAYGDALAAVTNITDAAYSSDVAFKQSVSDMEKQLARSKKTFNENTDAGRNNIRMVQASKDAMDQDAAAAYRSTYQNSKLTNETDRRREATKAANKILDKDVESLIQQGIKAGFSRDQMESLLKKMGVLTDTKAVAHVSSSGVGPTNSALDSVLQRLDYINKHTWYATVVQNVLPPGKVPDIYKPPAPSTGTPLDFLDPTRSLTGSDHAHAKGGSFSAHELMLVGEEGPEIVRFDRGGDVIPNHEIGKVVRGADSGEVAQLLRRNNELLAAQNAHLAALREQTAYVGTDVAAALNRTADQARHAARTRVRP